MKGINPTDAEKSLWSFMISSVGCIACFKDGRINDYATIHHIDGRTKKGSHSKVLPLCAEHHQHSDLDPLGRIGVHPYKARFEKKYGAQLDLLAEVMAMIWKKP